MIATTDQSNSRRVCRTDAVDVNALSNLRATSLIPVLSCLALTVLSWLWRIRMAWGKIAFVQTVAKRNSGAA